LRSGSEASSASVYGWRGVRNSSAAAALSTISPAYITSTRSATTALDVTIQAQILELLSDLQRDEGMALVLITHDMGVVAETAERVLVQYAGQQVERQPVRSLFRSPHHPYTAALLAALPDRAKGARLNSIPGIVPGQGDRPPACQFNPRCPYADDRCRTIDPPRQPEALGGALCHYPLNVAREAEATS
jgi:dipeptide transport system ATP-binding protein